MQLHKTSVQSTAPAGLQPIHHLRCRRVIATRLWGLVHRLVDLHRLHLLPMLVDELLALDLDAHAVGDVGDQPVDHDLE